MVVLTAEVVRKRLQDVTSPSQEQIETMSLWIMHYKDKASIDLIVDGWLNCFKSGTDGKRIALFYVMNDVVQKAKMKHADTLIPAFQPAVLTAVGVGRKQEKVKTIMKRCIQIFKSRNVFTPGSITAMENLLDADEGYDADDGALEVDTDDLVKKITNFVAARNMIASMMKSVNEGDFDYKEKCKTQMRDRESGAHILQEVHEVIDTMVQVRHSMENQKKKMVALSETLELAKRVFLHQKREVLVVEEAYVNFRDGIKAVHADLTEMLEKGVYPGSVSPMNDEDIYGNSGDADPYRKQNATLWGGDNRNQVDMEMDEEERPQAPMMKPSLQALVGIASQPSLQSRIMQLGLKKIADGDEQMLQHVPAAASSSSSTSTSSTSTATKSADYSRPPPGVFVPPAQTVASFGGGMPLAQTVAAGSAIPTDPRKRMENETTSQYGMNYQQTLNAQPQVYQGHFETRDPRILAGQQQQQAQAVQPQITGYQAQFETRDPRIAQISQQQQQPQQTAYQASFDAAPLAQSSGGGGYHGRFDQKVPPPPTNGSIVNQYQQQQQQQTAGFMNAGGQDYDGRGNSGSGGYGHHQQQNQRGYYQEDRRGAAAGSSGYGGSRSDNTRYRSGGGGYTDRNRGRDNWRNSYHGGSGGGYSRY